jgi:hypothetical protein
MLSKDGLGWIFVWTFLRLLTSAFEDGWLNEETVVRASRDEAGPKEREAQSLGRGPLDDRPGGGLLVKVLLIGGETGQMSWPGR